MGWWMTNRCRHPTPPTLDAFAAICWAFFFRIFGWFFTPLGSFCSDANLRGGKWHFGDLVDTAYLKVEAMDNDPTRHLSFWGYAKDSKPPRFTTRIQPHWLKIFKLSKKTLKNDPPPPLCGVLPGRSLLPQEKTHRTSSSTLELSSTRSTYQRRFSRSWTTEGIQNLRVQIVPWWFGIAAYPINQGRCEMLGKKNFL